MLVALKIGDGIKATPRLELNWPTQGVGNGHTKDPLILDCIEKVSMVLVTEYVI
jgi:hypothetical protein